MTCYANISRLIATCQEVVIGGERMKTAKSILSVDAKKIQILMADKCMDPYDLCEKAGISYSSYQRIMRGGGCKLSTLGKLSDAIGVSVANIIEE